MKTRFFDDRAPELDARLPGDDAVHVEDRVPLHPQVRLEVVDADLPVVAGAARLDHHEAGRKPAELHSVRVRHDRHRVDAVGRQRDAGQVGRRIDERRGPDLLAGLVRPRAVDAVPPAQLDDARRQADGRLDAFAGREQLGFLAVNRFGRRERVRCGHDRPRHDIDVLGQGDRQIEGERNGCAGGDGGGHFDRLKAVERGAQGVPARRKVRNRELAIAIGHRLREPLVGPAVDHHNHARQAHRSVLGRNGPFDRPGSSGRILGAEAPRSAGDDDQEQQRRTEHKRRRSA